VVGVLVAVGGIALATRDAPAVAPQVCQSSDDHLAGIWDDDVRSAMRSAFDTELRPYAPDSFRRVETILDGYAADWTAMHTEACERTHVHGDQSAQLLDLRMQCLERRARALDETTALLSNGVDGDIVDHAVETALQLPVIESCNDIDALLSAYPPPEDEETRQRVAAMSRRIAHAQALANAGKYADALAIAEQAALESVGVPYPPLQARAHYLLGTLQHELSKETGAEESLYAAARYGATARDDELVAGALVLIQINSFYRDRAAGKSGSDALDMSNIVEIALDRAGDANTARAAHLMSTGEMLLKLDRWDDSRPIFERAIALQTELYGDEDVRVAEALRQLASSLPDAESDKRLALIRRALAIKEHVLGGNHPEVAHMLNTLGRWTPDERVDDVVGAYDRSLAIFENAFGGDDWTVGRALNNGGEAMCLGGHYAEGLERLERGLAVYEEAFGADHCHLAYPLSGISDCYRLSGQPFKAVAPLERGLSNCTDGELHADLLAHTRFSLAKMLVASGGDRARARSLAEAARGAFATMGGNRADRLAAVEAWLSSRY
jgi:tetratricopeptide (TPR) repeat protein